MQTVKKMKISYWMLIMVRQPATGVTDTVNHITPGPWPMASGESVTRKQNGTITLTI
jgi:hypothetical protein